MPRPMYIICSQAGALDQYTNGISFFNVIESIRGMEVKPPVEGGIAVVAPLLMRLAAAWLREETDTPEQEFESQLVVLAPVSNEPLASVQFPPFRFVAPVHRLVVPQLILSPHAELVPGILRFECSIRRVGETGWSRRQEYVVPVEVVGESKADAKPSEATPPHGNGAAG